jgi:hypothetical protein
VDEPEALRRPPRGGVQGVAFPLAAAVTPTSARSKRYWQT